MKEESKQDYDGITIIEHNGELYFSDEFEKNNLSHPLYIPNEEK